MQKRILIHSTMVVSGIVCGLAAGELAVRFLDPQPAKIQSEGMYVRDSIVGYHLAPGHEGQLSNLLEYNTIVAVNSLGFRGEKPEGKAAQTRILFLGDSFVFGQGVESDEALPSVLEKQLRESGWPATVINGGVPGYGTVDEVAWLQKLGLRLNPDIVILGVFLGNDLRNNAAPVEERPTLKFGHGRSASQWWRPFTDGLYRYSHLYRKSRRSFQRWWATLQDRKDDRSSPNFVRRYHPMNDSLRRRQITRTRKALRQFRSVVDSVDSVGLAVLIPSRLQVDSGLRQRRLSNRSQEIPPSFDPKYVNDLWGELLKKAGIRFLDLTPGLESAVSEGDELYYSLDEHWNARGHAEAGRMVAEWLMSEVAEPTDTAPALPRR